MRKTTTIAASAIALTLAGTVIPTQANAAKVKFGSELNETVQPSNSLPGLDCAPMQPQCSFVQNEAYGRPDGGEKAPRAGTLKRVRVIAGGPGSFKLQLVKSKAVGSVWKSRVKAIGPKINYTGQSPDNWDTDNYKVESFRVDIPIKKGWRLAMKSRTTSAIRCSSGGDNTLIHTPPLVRRAPFASATGDDGCWMLIEGVIKY